MEISDEQKAENERWKAQRARLPQRTPEELAELRRLSKLRYLKEEVIAWGDC